MSQFSKRWCRFSNSHRWLRISVWVFFVLTVLSTLYFGWHYMADDLAGAFIAIMAVWIGGLATGQKFDRRGRSSHPTTSTSRVPLTEDEPPRPLDAAR